MSESLVGRLYPTFGHHKMLRIGQEDRSRRVQDKSGNLYISESPVKNP